MNNLKSIRMSKNLSQSKLSEQSGISIRVLQSYECGARNIDAANVENLLNLSTVLECKISDLIQNEDLKNRLKTGGY